MSRVSVVIPTFNRKQILAKALRAHFAQSAVGQINEILVVDDGSTDGTDVMISILAAEAPFAVRRLHQFNRGQAAARNLGISQATGEIILFTDDDIIPTPELLAEHLRWHDRHPDPRVAVMGYVEWAPEVHATPFMKWFGLDGPLFAYGHFKGKWELDDFRVFYSCNVSLKAVFLRESGGFDEDFGGYGYEDAELGFRLQKNGMRLLYNPIALAHHCKHVTFAEACARAQQVATAFAILKQKEAGKYLVELEGRQHSSASTKRRLKKLIGSVLHPFRDPVLGGLKLLVDSRIPLPWVVYRWLYAEATTCTPRSDSLETPRARPPVRPGHNWERHQR